MSSKILSKGNCVARLYCEGQDLSQVLLYSQVDRFITRHVVSVRVLVCDSVVAAACFAFLISI